MVEVQVWSFGSIKKLGGLLGPPNVKLLNINVLFDHDHALNSKAIGF